MPDCPVKNTVESPRKRDFWGARVQESSNQTTAPPRACPACGRSVKATGPCEQCGADLSALHMLWNLPRAAAPPRASTAPVRAAWLAPALVGLGVGLGLGIPGGLQLAQTPPAPVVLASAAPLVSVSPTPVPSVAPTPQVHRIVKGDTLSALALQFYGDEDRFDLLLLANPGLRPRALRIGTPLLVPPVPSPPVQRSTP